MIEKRRRAEAVLKSENELLRAHREIVLRRFAGAKVAGFGLCRRHPLARVIARDCRAQRREVLFSTQRLPEIRQLGEGQDETLIVELLADLAVRESAAVDVYVIPPVVRLAAR